MADIKKIRKRHVQLRSEFEVNWRPHFEDLSNYLLPIKGRFSGRDTTPNDGKKRMNYIIDATATRAIRILAAGMQSGLTSPARQWFRLGLADKDLEEFAPVRTYLDEVQKRMLAIFERSNFYNSVHSLYSELGTFGTAAMLMEEDYKSVIRCYPFTIGEYYVATAPDLRVDSFYREFKMTARNMVDKFGRDNVSPQVRNAAETAGTEMKWFDVLHVLEPNHDRKVGRQDNQNMPFISAYMELKGEEDKFLRVSGYEDLPVMVPRWDTTGSEVYGRSPGMDALPDVKMLQKMQEKALVALDKMVDPPMNAPTAMKNRGGTILSGGVNYIDVQQGQQGFTPAYQIQPDFQKMEYKIERIQTAIKEAFYNDLFLMLALGGDKQMTAREVSERHEEKLLAVGPVVERLQPELLDVAIDRTYNIMDRHGLLPKPPRELEGADIEIEYISLLAQAQRMVGISSLEQTANFAAGLAGVWPEARAKFDAQQAVDEFARMAGAPSKVVLSDEDAAARLQAEADQIQAQQQPAVMEQNAKTVKALSEADTTKQSALKSLTDTLGLPV
jgi:hypothetical protein